MAATRKKAAKKKVVRKKAATKKAPVRKRASRKPAAKKKTVRKKAAGMTVKQQAGDAAVKKATGKDWAGWYRLLDKAGAKLLHKEIAILLHEEHGLSRWWSQMVTVGYEQARGLRQVHEKPGGFEIGVSRTIAAPVSQAFHAWKEARTRAKWLKEKVAVRTARANKSMRLDWSLGKTIVAVNFYAKGPRKCQVAVQHAKLPDAKAAARMKKLWAARLDTLRTQLEG